MLGSPARAKGFTIIPKTPGRIVYESVGCPQERTGKLMKKKKGRSFSDAIYIVLNRLTRSPYRHQQPRSISLYFHFPFCIDRCLYCDFVTSTYSGAAQHVYVKRLNRELMKWQRLLHIASVRTVYFGGGTPSLARPEQIATLLLKIPVKLEPLEVTLESTPSSLNFRRIHAFLNAGITRFSVGFQSLDDTILRVMGRCHTVEKSHRTAQALVETGVCWNADFILGLPMETADTTERILKFVETYRPHHLSIYFLELHRVTPLAAAVRQGWLTPLDETELIAHWWRLRDGLVAMGYRHYEVSNFALPGHESRHNQVYWRLRDYIGIGVGAHSCMGPLRWAHPPQLSEYRPEKRIYWKNLAFTYRNRRERLRESCLLGLRTCEGISRRRLLKYNESALEKIPFLVEIGWLKEKGGRIACTPRGWLHLHQIYEKLGLL